MATSNCGTSNCGCNNSYTVTTPCPPSCTEVFNAQCIVYTGTDISCGDDTVISRYDYMDTIVTKIINYFCSRFDSLVIPTTVVESTDAAILVDTIVVGSVTTYSLSLDASSFPAGSIVAAGANVVVTDDGLVPTTYTVNANESIVAVEAGSALSLIVDPSTPGPYETTYTIGIDNSLLPDTILQTSFAHISIVEIPNTPNAGDTTYTLEVDEVDITSVDVKLDVINTNAGGIAPFERTFTVDINEAEMTNWIMESVIYSPGNLLEGLIEGPGISLNWNPATYQLQIENTFSDPERWFELIDFAATSIIPTTGTASLSILSDPADVGAGGNGISAVLSGTGTAARYDLRNTDPGTAQLIFGTIDCNNDGGASVGTAVATSNTDTLTLVGGAEISVSVPSTNTIVVDCDITSIYSNVAGDTGNVAAGTVTDSLEIVGAADSAITTAISSVPGVATLEIDWTGVTVGAGLSGTGLPADPLINTANIFSDITGDAGPGLTASGLTDSVYISGGKGIATDSGTNPGIVEIVADVAKIIIGAGLNTIYNHNLNTTNFTVSVVEAATPFRHLIHGVDYTIESTTVNDVKITNIGALPTANVRITVIG
jgi:hypothetical protein